MITLDPESASLAHTLLPRRGITVSTMWRRSSACVCSPPWYFETLAFKDNQILVQLAGSLGESAALKKHCGLVISLMRDYDHAEFVESDEGLYDTLSPIKEGEDE